LNERQIFTHALKLASASERATYLDAVCAGNPQLRAAVEALLQIHASDPGFLEKSIGSFESTLDSPATRSAPSSPESAGLLIASKYKLLEQIGEGGMGTVWMAQQMEPVKRLVAVKLIKPGMDSKQVLARFEAERQALALMDHPSIAKVLDAGTIGAPEPEALAKGLAKGSETSSADHFANASGSGRPFFVMELVKGVPITQYCDERRLTPRQRLELFVPLCHAIQHAHQKGVIHRDLKPSNVLVALYDDKPVPKIIDFGVAKATGQPLTEQTLHTNFGAVVGTVEYMSPEQATFNQLDVDTRSDIYSLGVLLYELLTGNPPFTKKDLEKAGMLEMLRVIREQEPSKPSTKLSTAEGLPTLAANRGMEPAKLTKLLRGELDWIVMKALEKDRNRRYETANGFAMDVQRYLADEPVQACPPSAGYRLRKFVRRNKGPVLAAALVLLALFGGVLGTTLGLVRAEQKAAGERRAKDSAEKRLAQVEKGIDLIGSLFADLDPMAEEKEGRPLRAILGDRLDQAAIELGGDAVGDPLVVARLQDRLGQTYLGLGLGARAETLFAKAAETRQTHLGADDSLTLGSRYNLALACAAAGKRAAAIKLFEEVRDARLNVLGPDHPDTLTTLNGLAVEYWRTGKLNEAVTLLERVRDGRVRHLGENHDDTLATLGRLAEVYLATGRRAEAVALAEKVWNARVRKYGDDHPQAIAAMSNLAYVYQGAYKMRPALDLFEQARDTIVPKLGPYHPLTFEILRYLGHMYRVYGRTSEAIALLGQVRERQQMILGGQHPSTLVTLWDLAGAYRFAGDPNKALPLYQQAAAGVERLQFEHSYADYILDSLAICYEELQQFDLAVAWRQKSLAVVERKHGKDSVDYAEELNRIGSNLLQQKKPADAEPNLRQALAILDKRPDAGEQSYAQSLLGMALADQQRYAEAEPMLTEAYQRMKNFAAEHKGAGAFPRKRQVDNLERLVKLYEAWGKPEKAAQWREELEAQKKSTERGVNPNDN
jgi:serine/threonine protein kinase/tetratricopeptide (TPR) repeat protein